MSAKGTDQLGLWSLKMRFKAKYRGHENLSGPCFATALVFAWEMVIARCASAMSYCLKAWEEETRIEGDTLKTLFMASWDLILSWFSLSWRSVRPKAQDRLLRDSR